MYWTMLRRELLGRKRQTAIVAAGLAVAIALVIVVSSLAAGIRSAQSDALASVYGVGTDLTVSGAAAAPGEGGGPRFEFGQGAGETSDGTTKLDQSTLSVQMGRSTLPADTVQTVSAIDGVAAATGVLSLNNITFSGEMPDFSQMSQGQMPGQGESGQGETAGPPSGGFDGAGGSAFDLNSFSVLGIDPTASDIGPISATTLTDGRAFQTSDAGSNVALLDESYASSKDLSVGDTISVAGTEMKIIGTLASTSGEAETAANVYLPIDVARSLAGLEDVVSAVYVSADSATGIASVQEQLETALPDATVSSQADLAQQVSGSLTSAASLITMLGAWLSIIVLLVALVISMLLTGSGVTRRTREFGTLKAIGWSNKRVVSQLAGESAVQALIGGAVGLILGLGAIAVINVISPTIAAGSSPMMGGGSAGAGGTPDGMPARPEGMPDFGGGSGMPGFGGMASQAASEITLHAPVTLWVVAAALGLSVLGGLVAGAFGAWRAARLSPAEALRSVA